MRKGASPAVVLTWHLTHTVRAAATAAMGTVATTMAVMGTVAMTMAVMGTVAMTTAVMEPPRMAWNQSSSEKHW